MPGLSDMEEMISTVPEKETADYLREAFVCYGAGAYRGCIVLTHIALFEGLRAKLHAVSAVNKAARQVLSIIEPDALAQKVFESKLIDQMRTEHIITQLDADILSMLNRQRNKAAHPSGHDVTAEEARFVFSEAIKKFLSKPIRQTSVLVESILERLPDPNFFPIMKMHEIKLVTEQEIEGLDTLGLPQLIVKLSEVIAGSNVKATSNARNFMCALASDKNPVVRTHILRHFITPKSSDGTHASFIASLIGLDPEIIRNISDGLRVRILSILCQNLENGKLSRHTVITNPFYVFGRMCMIFGEDFLDLNYKSYVDKVMEHDIASPFVISSLEYCPKLLSLLNNKLLSEAGDNNFAIANKLAEALPSIDEALGTVLTDEDATRLLIAVIKSAQNGAFDSISLANSHFESVSILREKALKFTQNFSEKTVEIITEADIDIVDIADAQNRYFSVLIKEEE